MKIIDASVMPVGAVRHAINSTVSNQFWLYKVLGHLTTNMIFSTQSSIYYVGLSFLGDILNLHIIIFYLQYTHS